MIANFVCLCSDHKENKLKYKCYWILKNQHLVIIFCRIRNSVAYLVGSSKNMILGLWMSSNAIESFLRSPPDKCIVTVFWILSKFKFSKIQSI